MPHSSVASPDAIGVLRALIRRCSKWCLEDHVDNFLTYVAQLLAPVFKEDPDVLKNLTEKLS